MSQINSNNFGNQKLPTVSVQHADSMSNAISRIQNNNSDLSDTVISVQENRSQGFVPAATKSETNQPFSDSALHAFNNDTQNKVVIKPQIGDSIHRTLEKYYTELQEQLKTYTDIQNS